VTLLSERLAAQYQEKQRGGRWPTAGEVTERAYTHDIKQLRELIPNYLYPVSKPWRCCSTTWKKDGARTSFGQNRPPGRNLH
jgi:hypothetical protein